MGDVAKNTVRTRALRAAVVAGACVALLGASITTAVPASALTRATTAYAEGWPWEFARHAPASTLVDPAGRVVTAGAWTDYTRAWSTSCTVTGPTTGPAPTQASLSRYRLDGSLDPAFGVAGVAILDLDALGLDYDDSELTSLAIDEQGRYLAVLTTTQRFCDVPPGTPAAIQVRHTVRLLTDGTLDPTFGVAGALTPAVTPHHQRGGAPLGTLEGTGLYAFTDTGVARLDDGSPVSCPDPVRAGSAIACRWSGLTGPGSLAGHLTLLDSSNGYAPEPGTDAGGAFRLPLPGSADVVRDARIRQLRWDGDRLLALVSVTQDPTPGYTAPYERLYALREDPVAGWVLDAGFGTGGVVHQVGATFFRAVDADVDSGGSVVVLASGFVSPQRSGFRLTRLTPGGSPDGTFGTGGASTLPCGWSWHRDLCVSLALTLDQADRPLVTAPAKRDGNYYGGVTARPAGIDGPVRRYTSTGMLEQAWLGNPRPGPIQVEWFYDLTRVSVTRLPVRVAWWSNTSLCAQSVNGTPTPVGTDPNARYSYSRALPTRAGTAAAISLTATECHTRYVVTRRSVSTPTIVTPRATASWVKVPVAGALGGSELRTRKKLVGVAVRVTGTHVALVASKGPGRGRMSILLNGRYYATVDLYSARPTGPMVVWQRPTLKGTHTVKVVNLATRGRPLGVVDAILAHS